MADVIDISGLTDSEIAKLATRCLDALNLTDRIQAILGAFHDAADREELVECLNEEEDGEAEG